MLHDGFPETVWVCHDPLRTDAAPVSGHTGPGERTFVLIRDSRIRELRQLASIAGELQIYLKNGLTLGFPSRFSSVADNVAQWLPP
jgi:hypothetical protein